MIDQAIRTFLEKSDLLELESVFEGRFEAIFFFTAINKKNLDFDADCFFIMKMDHCLKLVANKYMATKLSMALDARERSERQELPQNSIVIYSRVFPRTAMDIANIPDIDLQIVIGMSKIADHNLSNNDEKVITTAVVKHLLQTNGNDVL
jgi:hypothetical protein